MNSLKHTNVANATARNHYAAAGQVQDGALLWGGTAGGTGDVITITLAPVLTAYAAGQKFRFLTSAANTGATTLAVNALSAVAIKTVGGSDLGANALLSGQVAEVVFNGTYFIYSGSYQPLDATLSALSALSIAADKLIYGTGTDAFALADLAAVARTFLAQATQALLRTTGLGMSANGSSLVTAADYAAMKTLLGIDLTGYALIAGQTFSGEVIVPSAGPTSAYSAGFRGAPPATHDANYTAVLDDAGTLLRHTSGSAHAWTIPPNSSVSWPAGSMILVRNIGSGIVTLTRGSGVVLRLASGSTSKDVALAQWGAATLVREASDTWYAIGSGLS